MVYVASANLEIRVTDLPYFKRLIEATGELLGTIDSAAGSLEASENYETPRWVAEELRDAVRDFQTALGADRP